MWEPEQENKIGEKDWLHGGEHSGVGTEVSSEANDQAPARKRRKRAAATGTSFCRTPGKWMIRAQRAIPC